MDSTAVKMVFGDRLLIKPDAAKDVTDGGLFIPDTIKKGPPIGEVQMVGKACEEVRPGMRVMYAAGGTAPIKVGEETFHVMRESDAVFELDASGNVKSVFKDRILVDPDETSSTTKSGVIIPDAFKDQSSTGTVLQVGASVKETSLGARILFGKQAGAYVSVNGKELLVIRDADVVMEI